MTTILGQLAANARARCEEKKSRVPLEALRELFARPSLIVEKHGKNGPVELDLTPMIRSLSVSSQNGREIMIEVLGCAQNPTLNPLLLAAAIERYLPECRPDFVQCRRIEVYDAEMQVFR